MNCNGETSIRKVDVVLGTQWGDEGKGKIVDLLASKYNVVCRAQGGNNAGHTVCIDNCTYDFHLLPSGITNKTCTNIIGNGVVVNVPALFEEAETNSKNGPHLDGWKDRLVISDRAHMVFGFHEEIDGLQEVKRGSQSLGTTKRGIGPTYASKANRNGLRIGELVRDFDTFAHQYRNAVQNFCEMYAVAKPDVDAQLASYRRFAEEARPLVQDTVLLLNDYLADADKRILVEGANATLLDIDFGMYPFVTSSNCSLGGVCTGLGIPPCSIRKVIGVVKAYSTRVGVGFIPTYQENEVGEKLQQVGEEFGTTSGRKRRCGWLDLVAVRYTHMINHYTELAVTKLDILSGFDKIKIGVGYVLDGQTLRSVPARNADLMRVEVVYKELPGWGGDISTARSFDQLPEAARRYVEEIERFLAIPVRYIGVGKSRDSIIER